MTFKSKINLKMWISFFFFWMPWEKREKKKEKKDLSQRKANALSERKKSRRNCASLQQSNSEKGKKINEPNSWVAGLLGPSISWEDVISRRWTTQWSFSGAYGTGSFWVCYRLDVSHTDTCWVSVIAGTNRKLNLWSSYQATLGI